MEHVEHDVKTSQIVTQNNVTYEVLRRNIYDAIQYYKIGFYTNLLVLFIWGDY